MAWRLASPLYMGTGFNTIIHKLHVSITLGAESQACGFKPACGKTQAAAIWSLSAALLIAPRMPSSDAWIMSWLLPTPQ